MSEYKSFYKEVGGNEGGNAIIPQGWTLTAAVVSTIAVTVMQSRC